MLELNFDLESIPAPLALLDSQLQPLAVNRAYRSAFGPTMLDSHQRSLRENKREGPDQPEGVTRLPSGDVLVSFSPRMRELEQREQLSRQAMALSHVGAWRYMLEDESLQFSNELYQVFDLPRDWRVTPESISSLFEKEQLELLREECLSSIETGDDFELELAFQSPAGEKRWIRTIGRAEFVDGSCLALSGAVQDITVERATGESLAEMVERFAFAQSSADFGVWDYHPDSKNLHWDDALFPLYDVQPENFRGSFEDWADCVHPEDLAPAVEELEAAIRGEAEFDTQFRIILKDGSIRWIKATAHATLGEDGKAKRLVGFNYDITPTKMVEEELRASNLQLEENNQRLEELASSSLAASLAKSEFLANMSHEIRTPMNGVLGLTTVLLDTDLSPQQRDSVDIIRKSAEALLLLINDLLDFSKVESGIVKLDEQEVDIRDSVDDLVEFLALEAQRKGLEFYYRVDESVPPKVKLDPGRLRQILINLVGNAVKFTQQGFVGLRLDADDQYLHFIVRDTGPGIDAAEQSSIFEPFTQGNAPSSDGGTGLGLAICKRLAALMNGVLGLQSEPGQGTRFSLRIPLKEVQQASTEPGRVVSRAAVTGGGARERGALTETLKFLGARVSDEQPDIELVFQGNEPVHQSAKRFLIVPACDASKSAKLSSEGFQGIVTRPFRRRPLEKLLTTDVDLTTSREHAAKEGPLRHCRVLLVEDNKVNQEVAAKMLARIGCRHDTAVNGRDALGLLERRSYDLILMDLQMPTMDGFEATRRLKSEARFTRNAETPVVALTAHATPEHKSRCFDVGMSDYLTKPLRLKDLRDVFNKWLTAEPLEGPSEG
jgi:signal transduction histidine kinase/CheY-like chemotaxis protein